MMKGSCACDDDDEGAYIRDNRALIQRRADIIDQINEILFELRVEVSG